VTRRGGLAQLAERLLCMQKVRGSIPLTSNSFLLPCDCGSSIFLFFNEDPIFKKRGSSSVGRASALHAEGQGFDSPDLQFIFWSFILS
jgi:hypothetical protein